MPINLDGRSLGLDDIVAFLKGEPVRVAPAAWKRIDAARRVVEAAGITVVEDVCLAVALALRRTPRN